jgi:hypothetical protein
MLKRELTNQYIFTVFRWISFVIFYLSRPANDFIKNSTILLQTNVFAITTLIMQRFHFTVKMHYPYIIPIQRIREIDISDETHMAQN